MTKFQQEILFLLVPNDLASIQSKVKSQVTKVQWEIKVLLVPKHRSSIQNKVTAQVTKVKKEIKVLISAKGPLENKGYIGANRPSISTDEGKI